MDSEVRKDEKTTTQDPPTETKDAEKETTGKEPSAEEVEKQQEAQLREKFPGLKGPGTTAFLQKRLSKGTKYFDSGDYNMAKAKVAAPPGGKTQLAPGQKLLLSNSTGDTIPTPENVPHKKLNLNQSKLTGMS